MDVLNVAVSRGGLVESRHRAHAVLVRDGEVVGEGWHELAGGPHAEVVALDAAGERAHGSTLYVTMEPCAHHGRTPPCVDAVLASEELDSLVSCLTSVLSDLESHVLSLYLDGHSYEVIGERLDCDTKTVDNALQRVKRKVGIHLNSRAVKV